MAGAHAKQKAAAVPLRSRKYLKHSCKVDTDSGLPDSELEAITVAHDFEAAASMPAVDSYSAIEDVTRKSAAASLATPDPEKYNESKPEDCIVLQPSSPGTPGTNLTKCPVTNPVADAPRPPVKIPMPILLRSYDHRKRNPIVGNASIDSPEAIAMASEYWKREYGFSFDPNYARTEPYHDEDRHFVMVKVNVVGRSDDR
jgi:hypothetical protein